MSKEKKTMPLLFRLLCCICIQAWQSAQDERIPRRQPPQRKLSNRPKQQQHLHRTNFGVQNSYEDDHHGDSYLSKDFRHGGPPNINQNSFGPYNPDGNYRMPQSNLADPPHFSTHLLHGGPPIVGQNNKENDHLPNNDHMQQPSHAADPPFSSHILDESLPTIHKGETDHQMKQQSQFSSNPPLMSNNSLTAHHDEEKPLPLAPEVDENQQMVIASSNGNSLRTKDVATGFSLLPSGSSMEIDLKITAVAADGSKQDVSFIVRQMPMNTDRK